MISASSPRDWPSDATSGGSQSVLGLAPMKMNACRMSTVRDADRIVVLDPSAALAAAGFKLGVVSDAIVSPGRSLRRWLERLAPWTATVLVNGLIMTVFLWHMTAAVLFLGLLHAIDVGLARRR